MYLFMLQKVGENNSQLFKRFNSRIFSSHQIVIAFSFFSLPQLPLLLPILISFSKTQANKKPKANIHEEHQGAWMREAGDSLDLIHFPSRSQFSLPSPGEEWRISNLTPSFRRLEMQFLALWQIPLEQSQQHAPRIHYNGIFNSIGITYKFKEKYILGNGEHNKSYKFTSVELGKFTAFFFQRKEYMLMEGP